MQNKMYALVGNWHYIPGPRGYSVFSYDPENARLELLETGFKDLAAGQQAVDERKRIAYVVNECGDRRGETGGGGYVVAVKIDARTGHLTQLNEKESLSPAPSYFLLDKSGKYGVAVHHSGFGHVTKIEREKDGKYRSVTLFDDAAVVLFKIEEDGSLGDVCDVSVVHGEGSSGPHMIPHLHCAVADPSGEIFAVCDKGLDRIYTYRIDRENGRLVRLSETTVETGCCPRYGAFHPSLPVFYSNNEKTPEIFSFHYDVKSGEMIRFAVDSVQEPQNAGQATEPSDIVVHPGGNYLYVSDRGADMIAVFDIDEKGGLKLKQNIACGGKNPRGLCLSPDLRFMLVANSDTATIAVFMIREDGTLVLYSDDTKAVCPANIRILSV